MKVLFSILTLSLLALTSQAQSDSLSEIPGNSLKKEYNRINPMLNYSYNDSSQIHNYSNNWDFDNDGKKDSLFFIGNGGAHLSYHLRIILSSDNLLRDFPFLILDMPYLGSINDLKKTKEGGYPTLPQFVVHDFDSDGIDEVYLNVDVSFSSLPKKWKKRGVNSSHIYLGYENKDLIIKNYSN